MQIEETWLGDIKHTESLAVYETECMCQGFVHKTVELATKDKP